MADFYQEIDKLLEIEGGYSDRADDLGGKTNFGITEKTARAHGYTGDMRDLPKGTAIAIYKKDYWDACDLDREPFQSYASSVFQIAVNSGPGKAVELEKRALKIDPKLACLAIAQLQLYTDICVANPSQKANFFGWIHGRLLKYV